MKPSPENTSENTLENSPALRLFVTTTVGFEPELMKEIEGLNPAFILERGKGGVYVSVFSFRDVIYLNYALHTANRVLVELIEVQNPSRADIFQALYSFDWKPFFRSSDTLSIEVPFSAHAAFTNTLFAAQFMKDPICDRLRKETGRRPSVDMKQPAVRLQAFLTDDLFRFYFDSSNIPLFKRGYRSDSDHVAPLKETLAAALLVRAGFKPGEDILIDPCAGSGTFLIESQLFSHNIAPGLLRTYFGFIAHPEYDPDEDRSVKELLRARSRESIPCRPIGIESNQFAYRTCLQSITRAGLLGSVEIIHDQFQRVGASAIHKVNGGKPPTFCITNPPYGVRLASSYEELERLYRDIGRFMKEVLTLGGKGSVLIPRDGLLQKSIGLRPSAASPFSQGGIDCAFVRYDILPKIVQNFNPTV